MSCFLTAAGGSRNGIGKEGVKELGPSLRGLSKLHTLGLG